MDSNPKLIVINDSFPVKQRHVCWNVEKSESEWHITEIVESFYRHPDALNEAFVIVMESLPEIRIDIGDNVSHAIQLAYLASKVLEQGMMPKMVGYK